MTKKAEKRKQNVDVLLKSAWVHKYRVQPDLGVWVYVLSQQHMQRLHCPLEDSVKVARKADAFAAPEHGVIGGWGTGVYDMGVGELEHHFEKADWFSIPLRRGELFDGTSLQKCISALETVAQVVAMDTLAPPEFDGKRFTVESDSMVAVWATGSWRSKSKPLTQALRALAWRCLLRGVHPIVNRVKGIDNGVADGLSRHNSVVVELMNKGRRKTMGVDCMLAVPTLDDMQKEIDALRAFREA